MNHPFRQPNITPAIRVSSDTDDSVTDLHEPCNAPNRYLTGDGLYSNIQSLDVRSISARTGRSSFSSTMDDHLTESLLDRGSVNADVISHLDSLSSGLYSRRPSHLSALTRIEEQVKYIDDTPRGISDTARSSFIPPHLRNIPFPQPPSADFLNVEDNPIAYDPFRRPSTTTITNASFRDLSARSERGVHIQEQLHKLVSAFHERARKVKEQVVAQPPSPTLSPEEEQKPLPTQTIPLNQMPVRQPSPSRMDDHRFDGLPAWCNKFHQLPTPFEPQSPVYLSWLFLMSLAFSYNAYAIPYRAAFFDPNDDPDNYQRWWYVADYVCDALYLIDMLVFKTSVKFVHNGVWVENRMDIMRRYVKTWRFRLDILASTPFDILYLVPAIGKNPLLRINKLLKLPSYWEFQSRIDQVARQPHFLRVMNSLAYMLWMIHANGCLFYYISYLEGFDSNHWVYPTKRPAYLHCFWRSFIVATAVGNAPEPENIIENAYMVFSWLIGVFIFALLIGQIRDIFTQMTYQEDQYQATVDAAIRYLQNLRIPKSIQKKVRDWFHYNWEQHKTLDENSLLDGLPKKLKTDLVLSVHYNTLCKVQLLQGTDQSLLRDLVLKLKPVVFLPNDYICKRGEVGKEMYIVRSGVLEVITPDGKVVATLTEGSVFGEISLLSLAGGNRRTADVRSKGYSNLYVLSKADLHSVLRDYPETQEILKKKAQRLYQRLTPTEQRKPPPPVEVIRSRTPTPSMVSTVISVMNPNSHLRQRLSRTFEPQVFPKLLVQTDISSDDMSLPASDAESKTGSPIKTLKVPAPEITPLLPPPSPDGRRSPSVEMTRQRREEQLRRQQGLERTDSSDTELSTGSTRTLRPKRPQSYERAQTPVVQNVHIAPIAKLDTDSASASAVSQPDTPTTSFQKMVTTPFRTLFKRPQLPQLNDDRSSLSEPGEQLDLKSPIKSPLRKMKRGSGVFRLPPVNKDGVIGTRPPSLDSDEGSTYDNLHIVPPDLDESSSSDFSHPTSNSSRTITQL